MVFGLDVMSHGSQTRKMELICRVLVYNYHRACVISCVVLGMDSRESPP